MGKCRIAYENLLDYVDGRASAQESEALRHHLETDCADCEKQLYALVRVRDAMYAPQPLHAPESVLQRVRAAYRERFQPVPRVPVIARLIFDSRAELAFGGARSMGDLSYHMLYAADSYDIDLWQEPSEGGRWYIIGQVLPNDGTSAQAPLGASFQAMQGELPDVVMEGTEFHIADVPPGRYALHLRLANQEITVPDVLVGP